jgi:DNA-binding GntR family transcriptional regulator
MHQAADQHPMNHEVEAQKTAVLVVKRIRDAILDETFKPGDRLTEPEIGKMLSVSRSPVREAFFALEKEGTVVIETFKGAVIKPLSAQEASDIAEIRLGLIALAAKPAYRNISPSDFERALGLAKQGTRCSSAQEHFTYNRQFWDVIFERAQRPVVWEVFRQLDDRSARYSPLLARLFPNPAARPRLREAFIETLRMGKADEAVRIFKKAYLGITQQVVEHLTSQGLRFSGV